MARIRSIHPGLFTDEAFMEATPIARILMIGLWCEAFDDGVFEWKPVVLKARIFPADSFKLPEILEELERLNVIKRFEIAGKSYGVIRNFQRYQRPKKPNSSGVLSPQMAAYAGATSEPVTELDIVEDNEVPNRFSTGTEKRNQMEDGGWRMEDEGGSGSRATTLPSEANVIPIRTSKPVQEIEPDWPASNLSKAIVERVDSPWLDPHKSTSLVTSESEIANWQRNKCSFEQDVIPTIRRICARRKAKIDLWSYFRDAVFEARDTRLREGPPIPVPAKPRRSPEEQVLWEIWDDFGYWAKLDNPWPMSKPFPGFDRIRQALEKYGNADDIRVLEESIAYQNERKAQ
jgi:hypothetical protein